MRNKTNRPPANSGITIFFPCYNDEHTIGRLVKTAILTLSSVTDAWEVIIVDDGSTDRSTDVVRRMVRVDDRVRLVAHEKNKGYGAALQSGFRAATKDLIFYTDGDGQYDPKELLILLPLMTDDTDFVNGIKIVRKDPTYRVIAGNLYNFFVRWLFWLPIQDVDCDLRLIRKSIIKRMTLTARSGAICVELVKKAQLAGARFREASVHHFDRKHGTSQFFKLQKIVETLAELIRLWIQIIVHKPNT